MAGCEEKKRHRLDMLSGSMAMMPSTSAPACRALHARENLLSSALERCHSHVTGRASAAGSHLEADVAGTDGNRHNRAVEQHGNLSKARSSNFP